MLGKLHLIVDKVVGYQENADPDGDIGYRSAET